MLSKTPAWFDQWARIIALIAAFDVTRTGLERRSLVGFYLLILAASSVGMSMMGSEEDQYIIVFDMILCGVTSVYACGFWIAEYRPGSELPPSPESNMLGVDDDDDLVWP